MRLPLKGATIMIRRVIMARHEIKLDNDVEEMKENIHCIAEYLATNNESYEDADELAQQLRAILSYVATLDEEFVTVSAGKQTTTRLTADQAITTDAAYESQSDHDDEYYMDEQNNIPTFTEYFHTGHLIGFMLINIAISFVTMMKVYLD